MNTWKPAFIATLAATLLAPLPGAAVSLGEITVLSYLGDPFRATIPLQTAPGEEVDITCLSLAPPPPTEGMLYLRHAQLSLSRRDGNWQLNVTGRDVLNDPFISLLIQSGCQDEGRLVREYTVLVDPETYAAVPQTMEEKPAASKGSALPASPTKRVSPSRKYHRHIARTRGKGVKPGIEQQKFTQHAAPAKDQLKVLSGVGEAPAMPGKTEKERTQQREKELTRELDDKTAQFLAMQAQLTTLESKLAEMQKTIALQNKMLAGMQKPPVPAPKPAYSWKEYWPAGPGILIAGMIYFLASRSRKRSLENWEPTPRSRNSKKPSTPAN